MPVRADLVVSTADPASLLSDAPRSGWRGWMLRMGHWRGVLVVTGLSVALSLLTTYAIYIAQGGTGDLPFFLLVAALVPSIVAPLASGMMLTLLHEAETARAALREVAVRDGLTGLHNRRYFSSRLEREIERSRRQAMPLSLVLVDVDHFKRINDTYGHAIGDEVLRQLARVLQAHMRPYDLAARFGGEEFALLLPGAEAADAQLIAERVRMAIQALNVPALADRPRPHVTASQGIAALRATAEGADALMRRADVALYDAKSAGRNCSRLCQDAAA